MSAVVVATQSLQPKDPADIKVYAWDWDAASLKTGAIIVTSTWTITGITPVQEWSDLRSYAVGDQVLLGGVPYTSILASTNQTPPNVTYWAQVGTAMTKDSEAKLTAAQATDALQGLRTVTVDDRMTQVRLSAGTLGQIYEIANKIRTNETPYQEKERSFRVIIQNQ